MSFFFFFSSRRRHTRLTCDWSSDVCSSDLRQCLAGFRVVELGCGMGVPSLAAGRSGAAVLAADASPEALGLLNRNASRNGLDVDTAQVDWASPAGLIERGPFALVLAADVLYERASVPLLLAL